MDRIVARPPAKLVHAFPWDRRVAGDRSAPVWRIARRKLSENQSGERSQRRFSYSPQRFFCNELHYCLASEEAFPDWRVSLWHKAAGLPRKQRPSIDWWLQRLQFYKPWPNDQRIFHYDHAPK